MNPSISLDSEPQASPRRVLVVDEDQGLTAAVSSLLRQEGYIIESARRGAEALARAQSSPPSVLIVGLTLPDMDGLALADALAGDWRTTHLPILFISSHLGLATLVRGHHGLTCDFLSKPFSDQELLARTERCLRDGELRAALLREARIDDLTGLGNERSLHERLALEASRRDRYGTPLSIAFLDVDDLKGVNDGHGHLAGSAVLRAVGETLGRHIRDTDAAFRFGGDEFVILLPHSSLAASTAVAWRLLQEIRRMRPRGLVVSVSIGLSAAGTAADDTLHGQLERADAALYAAKRLGGDQLVVADG